MDWQAQAAGKGWSVTVGKAKLKTADAMLRVEGQSWIEVFVRLIVLVVVNLSGYLTTKLAGTYEW